ncbi:lutropin-choriogonadotropic hormone receptor-like, partial [Rhagoletis pomonella]|uniref:lutropin-choriogonadotropic hormone receptor-like n=1 Tax=Rhagoletis pomonella TaxID=28610 RepID=UPI0017850AD3
MREFTTEIKEFATPILTTIFYGEVRAFEGNKKHVSRDFDFPMIVSSNNMAIDLSSTSLERLPPVGLQDIEELRIESVHTLKTIPSIYNFKNLQRAFLTHSFHCCAFEFPSRHDPLRHAERLKEIDKWQQRCSKNVNENGSSNWLGMNTESGINDSLHKILRAKETENNDDGQTWSANGGGMRPTQGSGVFY